MTLKDQLDEFRGRYYGLSWLGVPTSDPVILEFTRGGTLLSLDLCGGRKMG